ncbi:hypothetical protein GA0116948_11078 [Chitinophaga costaii]|uniref:Uncharacterized protein n=1 Tax=Chitinophaga costaii TaxID=1335309 RepID=A0A1C4EX40_9BACT|nr:hypothetical protein [Chitinophaga costaii]SCC48124.1 hypothetical protein GA0116948_11078 [Chitinophaga costaii]
MSLVRYTLCRNNRTTEQAKQTAAALKEAIKNKTVSAAMIEAEISRIEAREARHQDLDAEKLAVQIHQQYREMVNTEAALCPPLPADQLYVRWLVYRWLSFGDREMVEANFFLPRNDEQTDQQWLETALQGLTEEQFGLMIRLGTVAQATSYQARSIDAYLLQNMASQLGVEFQALHTANEEQAIERYEKVQARIGELTAMAERLRKKEAANATNAIQTTQKLTA